MARAVEPTGVSALDDERIALLIRINLTEESVQNQAQLAGLRQQVSELTLKITELRTASRKLEKESPPGKGGLEG